MLQVLGSVLLGAPPTAAAQPPANGVPVRVKGPWSVAVGPGTLRVGDRRARIAREVILEVPRPAALQVRDEAFPALPVYDEKAPAWRRGAALAALVAEGTCTATGLLLPGSVRIRPAASQGEPFVLGRDYQLEPEAGKIGRVEGGRIAADAKVTVDYDYVPARLDRVVVDAEGRVKLVLGRPGAVCPHPPEVPEGSTAVAAVWIAGPIAALTDDCLFPIEPEPAARPASPSVAEMLLPKTLAKLRAGGKVTVVAWGDSVTAGGGVGSRKEDWYQNRFAALLRERFPKAEVTMLTAAWPGYSSRAYMDQPAGSHYDFQRDVLDPKPDLVTIEFVNDAYLNEEQTLAQYAEILRRITAVGAEVVIITPHLVRPDWMGAANMKYDEDPRPYVKGLKRFAAENRVALADASQRWCRLWRQGIPYITLETNWINHPDARGHEIFARTLIDLFPPQ